MRCISPLLIRTSNRREFVPCGKCNFCLQVKRADWSFRLTQEMKTAKTAKFLTLTYEEAPKNGLCKVDVQLFQKRLRKANRKKVWWPVRYYTVGEYGTKTERPHYHSIMFNLHKDVIARLSDIWQQGFCYVGEVSPASIHYVTKYVINRSIDYGGREPPFAFMSKRPGLGARYIETHKGWHREAMRNYTQVNGALNRLPRYYRDKMFSELERGTLASMAIRAGDESYVETLNSLGQHHPDPCHYYDERVLAAHEAVTSKINELNKF